MDEETFRTLRIDPRLESYQPFIDKAHIAETDEIAEPSRVLLEYLSSLWLEWVSGSHVVSLPYYGVLIAEAFVKGLKETRIMNQPQVRLVEYLMAHVEKEIVLNAGQTDELKRVFANLYHEWLSRDKEVPFPREDMWNSFIHDQCEEGREFALSVWSSERLAYAAVYYAYEHFLVKCARTRLPGEKLRVTNQDWPKRFQAAFGDSLLSHCWSDPQVYVAREVRNAIAHVGGRITPNLEGREQEHQIAVVDDHLHVFPKDIKRLYEILRDPVQRLVRHAVTLPEFLA